MSDQASLDEMVESLSRCLDEDSARRIAEFRLDERVQTRIESLAAEANEGTLTDERRNEYESLINAADFISLLKLRASKQVQSDAA